MNEYTKSPGAAVVIDIGHDWSDWLVDGDTIATSVWDVPDGLTNARDEKDGTGAVLWISGGEEGDIYLCTNRITTTQGRTDERSIRVKVLQR